MTTPDDDTILLTPDEVRHLIAVGIDLGHHARGNRIPLARAKRDATTGQPVADLIDGLRHHTALRRAATRGLADRQDPTP